MSLDHPPPPWGDRLLTPDESWCYVHGWAEPGVIGAYQVCGECGHVYRTAADLEDAWEQMETQMYGRVVAPRNASDIFSCQECAHDF